jgi:hypothetical protein
MEIDKQRIEDAIISQVSKDIISDEAIWDRAKSAFDARVDKLWKDVAEQRIRSEIELAISSGLEREYIKVDSFGQQKGPKTTIRAELEKQIGGYWNEKVDRHGKPSSGYGADLTRAEWMMTQLVASDFQGEMKQHVVNVGGALKDQLRLSLHGTINELVSGVFKVNSVGDREIGTQGSHRTGSAIIDPPAAPTS